MLWQTIKRICLKNGEMINVPENCVVAIVGANNAGKTTFLNELYEMASSGVGEQRIVTGVEVEFNSDETLLKEWFDTVATGPEATGEMVYSSSHYQADRDTFDRVRFNWMQQTTGYLSEHYYKHISAIRTPELSGPKKVRRGLPPEPFPIIYKSREIERDFSKVMNQIFGIATCVNRYSDSLQLLIGEPSSSEEDVIEPDLTRYDNMKPLSTYGDGTVSFASLALNVFLYQWKGVFIDEPEAHLHPPQARLLGRLLSEKTHRESQVFLATHSSDVLQGMIENSKNRPTLVLRLDSVRDVGAQRRVAVLSGEQVGSLWSDPLLRYSGMLDALFHKGVIACEGDGDSLYYRAAFDSILGPDRELDITFIHANGKARVRHLLQAAKDLEIPSACIVDIDVLNDVRIITPLVKSAGGDFDKIKDDLKTVTSSVSIDQRPSTFGDLKRAISEIGGKRDAAPLFERDIRSIKDAISNKSGWRTVKRTGESSFEGEAFRAYGRIKTYLSSLGIFIVPVGELERWNPEVTAKHGGDFATKALERRVFDTPSSGLEVFIEEIYRHFMH